MRQLVQWKIGVVAGMKMEQWLQAGMQSQSTCL
jgi:hypothetical protein